MKRKPQSSRESRPAAGARPAPITPPRSMLTTPPEALARYGIWLFALAWPLGAYQRVVGPVHLHHLAMAPLLFCMVNDWLRDKRLRTPFELWWPCALIALLDVGLWLAGAATIPGRLAGPALFFIVATHVSCSRGVVLWAFYLSVVGGVAMMLLSVLAAAGLLFPTAWTQASGLVVAGPYGMSEGIFTATALLLVLPALLCARRAGEFAPGRTGILVMATLPVLVGLWLWLNLRLDMLFALPGHALFLHPTVWLLALALWGCARVAAKLVVARRLVAAGAGNGWLAGGVVGAMIAALLLLPRPETGPVFLLALAAAYARPGTGTAPVLPPRRLLGAPLVGLLIVHLLFILPGDPRDYGRQAQRALARKEYAALRDQLDFIKTLAPKDVLPDYYIARAWLAENELHAAAAAFRLAMRESRPGVLAAPDVRAVDLFLAEMRDRSSAMPERLRGLAYEQCLIAAGRERHALSLLELRGEATLMPNLTGAPFAQALAAKLGALHLEDVFRTWDPGLLLAILASAGPSNQVLSAPPEFPASQLPLIVMASADQNKLNVNVYSPVGRFGGVRMRHVHHQRMPDVGALFADSGWGQWRQDNVGAWLLSYGSAVVVRLANAPQVHFQAHMSLPDVLPMYRWDVTVWLPEVEEDHG